MEAGGRPKIKATIFSAVWALWLALVVVVAFLTAIDFDPGPDGLGGGPGFLKGADWLWGWIVAYATFLPLEACGIWRRGRGDTFSELTWLVIQDGTSRRAWGRCMAWTLTLPVMLCAVEIAGDVALHWAARIAPLSFFMLGVAAWLREHFPELGRTG